MIEIALIGDDLEDLIDDFILTLGSNNIINIDGLNSSQGAGLVSKIHHILNKYEVCE